MERVVEALKRLETRMDTMEKASVSVSNGSPVSPRMQHAQPGRRANGRNVAQAGFAGSEFRRAIDGGSALGRTPMQIDELSGMGPFGAGSCYRRAEARVNQGAAEAQAALQAQVAAQAHHQPAPPPTPYADPGCLLGLGGQSVPNARDSKLMIGKFNGVEQYKGLGTGFRQWALLFLEAIEVAELGCGYQWTERVKANKLQQHLEGKALQYYQAHIEGCAWECCGLGSLDLGQRCK
ncbi:unnamed protein product [Peronospora destructor]|uniref:Uncharacterized protein n=1 Tax=Peronospora destructor TaxID=86335 RepID=A0AAV0VD65_9STRA|nr:unnamed protein product [Peronospora destructor]